MHVEGRPVPLGTWFTEVTLGWGRGCLRSGRIWGHRKRPAKNPAEQKHTTQLAKTNKNVARWIDFFCFHYFCRTLFLSASVRVTFTLKTLCQATLVAFTFWEKWRKGRHLQNSFRDEKLCQKIEDLHRLETNLTSGKCRQIIVVTNNP